MYRNMVKVQGVEYAAVGSCISGTRFKNVSVSGWKRDGEVVVYNYD